jgi:hypothetical protein
VILRCRALDSGQSTAYFVVLLLLCTKCSMQDEDCFKSGRKRSAYCSDRYNSAGVGDRASLGERSKNPSRKDSVHRGLAISALSTLKQNMPLSYAFAVKSLSWCMTIPDVIVMRAVVIKA